MGALIFARESPIERTRGRVAEGDRPLYRQSPRQLARIRPARPWDAHLHWPLLIDQIGRSHLLSLPVPVVELPWGGVRIDLCERPWEATREQLHEAWLAAMQHLRPTGVFATYEVEPNGAVVWTRGPNLVNQGGRAP